MSKLRKKGLKPGLNFKANPIIENLHKAMASGTTTLETPCLGCSQPPPHPPSPRSNKKNEIPKEKNKSVQLTSPKLFS